jgi:type IV secretion system protein VirB3
MFLLFAPIHGLAYALTVRDNRFVDILLVRYGKCPITRNHRFWGGDSYKP